MNKKNTPATGTYLLWRASLLTLLLLLIKAMPFALGQQEDDKKASAPAVSSGHQRTPTEHDGQHDFDFEIGTWKTHLWSLRRPLTDSTEWVESKGIVLVRKVWNGRANLVELEAESPAGPFEFLNLRLYNAQTQQWNDYFATSKDGTFMKPMIGEFKNGRGEFFFHEKLNGRAMFFRSVISDITPDSCRFEDAFSDDGGKTWKVKGIAMDTRVKGESLQQNSDAPKPTPKNTSAEHDGEHDFDFEIGTWKTHLWRLVDPLTGSTKWVEYEGTSVVRNIWDGRGNLVELVADGPTGHFEGLNLRLYNPQSRQWSLNFANSKSGALSPPTIGEFNDGRGEFFSQETLNGRAILVRFVISDITPDSCRFEQAFSNDGGKTWEVNWIAIDTRVKREA
jgi:putative component of membrane protein insertase Oxa1/YidC/SpoIIIJ protein YidD